LASADLAFNTTKTEDALEMNREAVERKLHRMGKVHNFLEMWQGSQKCCATQKKSCVQIKQTSAIGYITDSEEIITASWLNI